MRKKPLRREKIVVVFVDLKMKFLGVQNVSLQFIVHRSVNVLIMIIIQNTVR